MKKKVDWRHDTNEPTTQSIQNTIITDKSDNLEGGTSDNDEERRLTSFTAKVRITSLNSHFPHLKPQHKMLEAGLKRQTVN